MVYSYPSHNTRFCSRPCVIRSRTPQTKQVRQARSEALRGTRKGRANPNWKHGKREGSQDRRVAREFNLLLKGEFSCRVCGSDRMLALHHIIPRSIGTKESKRDLRNGMPLCASCHMGWHRRGLVISWSLLRPDEQAYVASVDLTGRSTEGWLAKNYPGGLQS